MSEVRNGVHESTSNSYKHGKVMLMNLGVREGGEDRANCPYPSNNVTEALLPPGGEQQL